MTTAGYGHLRATDADRESVHSLLQAAYADGRLTWDEFDSRSTALTQAKTYDQLSALTADLYRPVPQVRPLYQPVPATPPVNQMAVISLSFGLGQVLLPVVGAIVAVVCGHRARTEISRTGEGGAGMALAGLILGYIGVSIPLLILLAVVAVAGVAAIGG
jgi:hypothetical protein